MLRADRFPDVSPAVPRRDTVWLAGGAVAAVTAAAVLPPSAVLGGPTVCPFRIVTGLPCPACGLTRSWVLTAHGDLAGAFTQHWLGPASLALTVLGLVLFVVRRPLTSSRPARLTFWALVISTAAYGVWRGVLVARGEWSGPY